MTDNEIIKALECCTKQGITSECERCKVKKGCRAELIVNALDLINRQKAEIEKIETLEYYKKILDYYALQFGTVRDKQKVIAEAKAEAVKEFANKIRTRLNCNTPRGAYLLNIVDNLLKEMVGDE